MYCGVNKIFEKYTSTIYREKTQLKAVQKNAFNYFRCYHPSEKVLREAMMNNPGILICKPSGKIPEDLLIYAVTMYPSLIEYIDNPSEDVKMIAKLGYAYDRSK